MPINLELEKMYLDDQEDRSHFEKDELSGEELVNRDSKRLKILKHMLQNNEIDLNEVWNLHYSALILHHSEERADNEMARDFAKNAVDKGSSTSKWLFAATVDRLLIREGKKQKFGTQFQIINGKKVYFPVDGSVSETEKTQFGIVTD